MPLEAVSKSFCDLDACHGATTEAANAHAVTNIKLVKGLSADGSKGVLAEFLREIGLPVACTGGDATRREK